MNNYYLYLVETKKEYTTHLIQLLHPLIYEGLQSIYDNAKKNSNEIETLKIFQIFLRKIPNWSDYIIEQEKNRILKISCKGDIIEDLIKAVIKSNIMLLTNTTPENKDKLKIKHDITTSKFIHNSYIEVARNIYQNPYLFYHKYSNYETKKNQRDANDIIKSSIIEAIRKILPMNIILQNYLGNTFENKSENFNELMSDSEYKKIKLLLNKDPYKDKEFDLVKLPNINKNTDKCKINDTDDNSIAYFTQFNKEDLVEIYDNTNIDKKKIDNIQEQSLEIEQNNSDSYIDYNNLMHEDTTINFKYLNKN